MSEKCNFYPFFVTVLNSDYAELRDVFFHFYPPPKKTNPKQSKKKKKNPNNKANKQKPARVGTSSIFKTLTVSLAMWSSQLSWE